MAHGPLIGSPTISSQDVEDIEGLFDFQNLPASNEAILASTSGNTFADRETLGGLYGVLDEGIGTFNAASLQAQNDILGTPAFNALRDDLARYSSPGYEALTRAMLARESQAITRAAIGTGQQAAASLRRSGITDSGLAGAFQTLGAVRGAGDRAILEGNRLAANETLRGEAQGRFLQRDQFAKRVEPAHSHDQIGRGQATLHTQLEADPLGIRQSVSYALQLVGDSVGQIGPADQNGDVNPR